MELRKVNLNDAFSAIGDYWKPHIAGEVNGTQIKLARIKGEFVWHSHAEADEAFLVLEGELTIELRDGKVELGPGELVVIPRGTEHRPICAEECRIMLIEPAGTLNTGDAEDMRTIRDVPRL